MMFDKRQTNIAKGVAVLLLLWHHLFFNSPDNYSLFNSLFSIKGIPAESFFADFCKVCVAVFLVLSGYGLHKNWESYRDKIIRGDDYKLGIKNQVLFVKNHLLKLMFSFWFVYIIFVPLSIWFGTPFWEAYQNNLGYGVLDFLGVAFLFGTTSINATWWFMSPIIVYYLIFPLLEKLLGYCGELLLSVAAVVLFVPVFYRIPGQISIWLFSFVLGMYLSKNNLLEKLYMKIDTYPKKIMTVACALIVTALIRMNNSDLDAVFAVSIILASYFLLSHVPILNVVFEHLGRHSGKIFMFHTFIFSLYFKDFIYWFKYPPIIFLVLTVICYVVAVGLEYLKKLIRYDKLINLLISKVKG